MCHLGKNFSNFKRNTETFKKKVGLKKPTHMLPHDEPERTLC